MKVKREGDRQWNLPSMSTLAIAPAVAASGHHRAEMHHDLNRVHHCLDDYPSPTVTSTRRRRLPHEEWNTRRRPATSAWSMLHCTTAMPPSRSNWDKMTKSRRQPNLSSTSRTWPPPTEFDNEAGPWLPLPGCLQSYAPWQPQAHWIWSKGGNLA